MQIGILGSGEVGQTLGKGLVALGHHVMIGTRTPAKQELRRWREANGTRAQTGLYAEAASFGEMIFLCTRWLGTGDALAMAGKDTFRDKLVVDVTNPVTFDLAEQPPLLIGHSTSAGELVQGWLPQAKVVKAFNTIAALYMTDGSLGEEHLDMFIAGNDPDAKKQLTAILTAWNWVTHDLGGIEQSRLLEAFAMLWMVHGYNTGHWNHAFKLVYK